MDGEIFSFACGGIKNWATHLITTISSWYDMSLVSLIYGSEEQEAELEEEGASPACIGRIDKHTCQKLTHIFFLLGTRDLFTNLLNR